MIIPLTLLEQIIRLINNAIEARMKDPTSTAQYVTFFWIFWPMAKHFLNEEQEKQIEGLVKAITAPANL